MTRRAQHPRLVDVAALAGVSMRTVSNVVNDYPHVAQATRERVEKAIIELDYRPNMTARNLARGQTGLVALVVPGIEPPYFASLAQRMLESAEAHGVVVLVQQTHGSHQLELDALEGRFDPRIDGVVLSPTTLTDADVASRRSTLPLVLLGEMEWQSPVVSVAVDQVAASRAATEHLLDRGLRRIAVVGPDLQRRSGRWRGWHDALAARGLQVDPGLEVDSGGLTGEHGAAAGQRIAAMNPLPDGVFCMTDWLALGVIRSLQRAGLRVPEDIAIVGYDNIPYGRASNPTLTTIEPDRADIAETALRSVLDQAAGRAEPHTHRPAWRLVVRESSGGTSVDLV